MSAGTWMMQVMQLMQVMLLMQVMMAMPTVRDASDVSDAVDAGVCIVFILEQSCLLAAQLIVGALLSRCLLWGCPAHFLCWLVQDGRLKLPSQSLT